MPTWGASRVKLGRNAQFYLGTAFSGAPMHYHQAAYNVLVWGEKHWYVTHSTRPMSPDVTRPDPPDPDPPDPDPTYRYLTPPGHSTFSTQPAREWVVHTLPHLDESASARVYECVQHAGDVLVLPDLWGHLTLNLDVSVGLAQEFEYHG